MAKEATLRPDGFRDRGRQVTRLEAFVDAAFAFAVTLLVISLDSIPDSSEALLKALRSVPAFGLSFVLIAMFWFAHNTWSRRYGLDDFGAIVLSLVLVFLVLVYVYPLRMLFGSLFAWLSRGWIPAGFQIRSYADVALMFQVYAVAWATLGLVIVLLYRHAWKRRDALGLDRAERLATRGEIARWMLVPITGVLSLVVSVSLPERPNWWLAGAPGMVYSLMGLTGVVMGWYSRRQEPSVDAELARLNAALRADPTRTPPWRRRRRARIARTPA